MRPPAARRHRYPVELRREPTSDDAADAAELAGADPVPAQRAQEGGAVEAEQLVAIDDAPLAPPPPPLGGLGLNALSVFLEPGQRLGRMVDFEDSVDARGGVAPHQLAAAPAGLEDDRHYVHRRIARKKLRYGVLGRAVEVENLGRLEHLPAVGAGEDIGPDSEGPNRRPLRLRLHFEVGICDGPNRRRSLANRRSALGRFDHQLAGGSRAGSTASAIRLRLLPNAGDDGSEIAPRVEGGEKSSPSGAEGGDPRLLLSWELRWGCSGEDEAPEVEEEDEDGGEKAGEEGACGGHRYWYWYGC